MNPVYEKLLRERYGSPQALAAEIINLEAILRLPKGTEHFMSDLHGEYEAFCHIMNNCSGVVREKVDALFSDSMTTAERDLLSTIIYYPRRKLEECKAKGIADAEFYKILLFRLVEIAKTVSSKYTRSKVRKSLPKDFEYIIDEMLNVDRSVSNKEEYYMEIFDEIISLNCADAFVRALCGLIKRLAVDHLHIVGDIFDRGPRPDRILDILCEHHSCDVQWGNHDICWIGGAMGNLPCILNILEISLKYGNVELLEHGYGINLRELAFYADKHYAADPAFAPHGCKAEGELVSKMRKAAFMLCMKAEEQTIRAHPEYRMEDRLFLHRIEDNVLTLPDGSKVRLKGKDFPGRPDPRLTEEESRILENLAQSFRESERLQRHLRFLMQAGSVYRIYNGNLLFHGCIPMCGEDFACYEAEGRTLFGKAYLDYCDRMVRRAYAAYRQGRAESASADFCWYLWCGPLSPLFGRDRMATFERQYLEDERTHAEPKNSYYRIYDRAEICERILREFGLDPAHSHIVNGHIPVISGENPVKAGGKLIVIDGGFCKAYHERTGIAGYTLIYNSWGMRLAAHQSFESIESAIRNHTDIHSTVTVFETAKKRIKVADTDVGRKISAQIGELTRLLKHD